MLERREGSSLDRSVHRPALNRAPLAPTRAATRQVVHWIWAGARQVGSDRLGAFVRLHGGHFHRLTLLAHLALHATDGSYRPVGRIGQRHVQRLKLLQRALCELLRAVVTLLYLRHSSLRLTPRLHPHLPKLICPQRRAAHGWCGRGGCRHNVRCAHRHCWLVDAGYPRLATLPALHGTAALGAAAHGTAAAAAAAAHLPLRQRLAHLEQLRREPITPSRGLLHLHLHRAVAIAHKFHHVAQLGAQRHVRHNS